MKDEELWDGSPWFAFPSAPVVLCQKELCTAEWAVLARAPVGWEEPAGIGAAGVGEGFPTTPQRRTAPPSAQRSRGPVSPPSSRRDISANARVICKCLFPRVPHPSRHGRWPNRPARSLGSRIGSSAVAERAGRLRPCQNAAAKASPSNEEEGLSYFGVPVVAQSLWRGPCRIWPWSGSSEDRGCATHSSLRQPRSWPGGDRSQDRGACQGGEGTAGDNHSCPMVLPGSGRNPCSGAQAIFLTNHDL